MKNSITDEVIKRDVWMKQQMSSQVLRRLEIWYCVDQNDLVLIQSIVQFYFVSFLGHKLCIREDLHLTFVLYETRASTTSTNNVGWSTTPRFHTIRRWSTSTHMIAMKQGSKGIYHLMLTFPFIHWGVSKPNIWTTDVMGVFLAVSSGLG